MARSFEVSGVDIIRTLRQAEREDRRPLVRRLYEKLRRQVMADHERPQAGEHGIKELDEFLDGFFELGGFLAERLADGADVGDALALGKKLLSKDFRNKLITAGKGVDQIPREVKDMTSVELEYLVEKFKTDWLPRTLLAYAAIAEERKKQEGSE